MPAAVNNDKRGHVCPPSDAQHPSGRWESLFVYTFITRFTNLRGKVEGFESPMDLENAILLPEPNDIITSILTRFILNLKPQTRNLSQDQISTTVASVVGEYLKTTERTNFWSEELNANVDPFLSLEGGFFTASWDFKLKILRQMVELQLIHCPEIKSSIDRAWGVAQSKSKKKDTVAATTEATREDLQFVAIGQDVERTRYWVADDSPRIYVSTNPWRVAATFNTISTTRDEYIAAVEKLRSNTPVLPQGRKKGSKLHQAHLALIKTLDARIAAIDEELVRVERARKRIETRKMLLAQAELRETRTRRQAKRPDYVYSMQIDSDGEGGDDGDFHYTQDDEKDQDDEEFEDDTLDFRDDASMEYGSKRPRRAAAWKPMPASTGTRRSTRTTVVNSAQHTREVEPWGEWRGERRSTRLGAPPETQLDVGPPRKRARTEDSSTSGQSPSQYGDGDATGSVSSGPGGSGNGKSNGNGSVNGLKLKSTSAAALKPTEVTMDQVSGKKRSKFWVYAVEPGPEPLPPQPRTGAHALFDDDVDMPLSNGNDPGDFPPDLKQHDMEVDLPNGANVAQDVIHSAVAVTSNDR